LCSRLKCKTEDIDNLEEVYGKGFIPLYLSREETAYGKGFIPLYLSREERMI